MPYEGPGTYLHFKGAKYDVLGHALHTETNAEMIVYRPHDARFTSVLHVRPRSVFDEGVVAPGTGPEYGSPGAATIARFTLVEPLGTLTPGDMHPVDKAFYDLVVGQRDRAWREIEDLKRRLGK